MKGNRQETKGGSLDDATPTSTSTASNNPTSDALTSSSHLVQDVQASSAPPVDPPASLASHASMNSNPTIAISALYSQSSSQGTNEATASSSGLTSLTSNGGQASTKNMQHLPHVSQDNPPKPLLGTAYTSMSHPTTNNSAKKLKLVPSTPIPDRTGAYHGETSQENGDNKARDTSDIETSSVTTSGVSQVGMTESGSSTQPATVVAELVDSANNIHERENAQLREQLRMLQSQQQQDFMVAQVVLVEDDDERPERLEPVERSYSNAINTEGDASEANKSELWAQRRGWVVVFVVVLLLGAGIVALVVGVTGNSFSDGGNEAGNNDDANETSTPTENGNTLLPSTGVPANGETMQPSSTLTLCTMPSILPSSLPSVLPSIIPTLNPTNIPTYLRTSSPTTFPTTDPTQYPTFSRRGFWLDLVAPTLDASTFPTASVWDAYLLNNPETPQAQAIAWLTEVDVYTESYESMDTAELMERYVFAVFYYSTSGPDWVASLPFLDPTMSVCEWNNGGEPDLFEYISDDPDYFEGVYCGYGDSPAGLATQLFLSYSEGSGSLPTEIAQLERLLSLEFFTPTDLTGPLPKVMPHSLEILLFVTAISSANTLPATWNGLPNLTYMNLANNNLQGTIPTQWTSFENLNELHLFQNSLSGPIPSSLGSISSLGELSLSENNLTGSLPSELAALTSLVSFYVDGNFQLGGTIPTEYALNWSDLVNFHAHHTNISGSFEMICEAYDDTLSMVSNCLEPEIECSCCGVCCDSSDSYCSLLGLSFPFR